MSLVGHGELARRYVEVVRILTSAAVAGWQDWSELLAVISPGPRAVTTTDGHCSKFSNFKLILN